MSFSNTGVIVMYLGEKLATLEESPYKDYTPKDWALEYIMQYGGISGDHHKAWVLDQVARILHGTPINLTVASWSNGKKEYRFETGEPSQAYLDYVKEARGEYDKENDEYEYSWDEGIAP